MKLNNTQIYGIAKDLFDIRNDNKTEGSNAFKTNMSILENDENYKDEFEAVITTANKLEIFYMAKGMNEKVYDVNMDEFALLNPKVMPFDLVPNDIINLSMEYFNTLKNIYNGASASLTWGDKVLK